MKSDPMSLRVRTLLVVAAVLSTVSKRLHDWSSRVYDVSWYLRAERMRSDSARRTTSPKRKRVQALHCERVARGCNAHKWDDGSTCGCSTCEGCIEINLTAPAQPTVKKKGEVFHCGRNLGVPSANCECALDDDTPCKCTCERCVMYARGRTPQTG